MFGYYEIGVDFLTDSAILIWLTLVLLILLAVYLYRRPTPPLPFYLKIVLSGLRIIAVLVLLAALAEPVVSYVRRYERPRQVTVMVDASLSMDRIESGKSRSSRLDSLLTSNDYDRLKTNVELTTHYFGGNLAESPDEVIADRTALGDIIDQMTIRQVAWPPEYWLLFSDGKSNAGQDPQATSGRLTQPVITVDLSADTGTFDIGIDEIDYNPVLFVGQRTELEMRLNWLNAAGESVAVELLDSNRIVAQTGHNIAQKEGYADITLPYIPESPGQKILTLNIPVKQGEEAPGNNQRSFSVKVLKSRILTLIVTSAPDYEIGFLKRLLEETDKYEVDLVVTGAKAGNLGGRFPSRQTELNRYDLIILHDPDPRRYENARDLLISYLSEKGGAVWVLMGDEFSRRGPVSWFNDLLPFYQTRRDPIDYLTFHGEPTESHLFHPAIRLDDNPVSIRQVWSELPPFRALVKCGGVHADAVVLANASLTATSEQRYPILGYRRIGPGKLMASSSLPFWPWGFVNLGFGEDHSGYGKFIEGTVSWLTVTDDLQPIRVRPEKDVFNRGETIRFDGFAFDLGFRPIPDVTGTVTIDNRADDRTYETDFIAVGEGAYRAWLYNTPPGTYRYRARIEKDGKLLKEETGSILVESFSLEELDQTGDPATLAAISNASGGGYFKYDRFDHAVNAIDLSSLTIEQKGELKLLNKPLLLIIFIFALCSEWLIRKINQLL